MSVKIRLMRVGKKKQPSYRVVVADGRSPRDGRYIEIIGHYQPRHEPSGFDIDEDKVLAWLNKGAQPTEQVHKLLVGAGIWETYESSRSSQSTAAKVAAAQGQGPGGRAGRGREGQGGGGREGAAEAKAAEAKRRGGGEGGRGGRPSARPRPAEDAPAEESSE